MPSSKNQVNRCPSCKSSNLRLDSAGSGVCSDCGKKVLIRDGCVKVKLLPDMNRRDFLREAWIHMATTDAPLDVFESDFGDVETLEYRLMVDSEDVRVPYQVIIGMEQRHPIYADATIYTKETVWTPFASEFLTTSVVCVVNGGSVRASDDSDGDENGSNPESAGEVVLQADYGEDGDLTGEFDSEAFRRCMEGVEYDSIGVPDDEQSDSMKITIAARSEAEHLHDAEIDASLKSSIIGDQYKGLGYKTEITESSTWLYLVPEYKVSMSYGGETRVVRKFPFGNDSVRGDVITGRGTPKAFAEKKGAELAREKQRIRTDGDEKCWRRNRKPLYAAMVLLVLSIVASVVLSALTLELAIVLSVALVLFTVAVALYVCARVSAKRRDEKNAADCAAAIAEFEKRIESETKSYSEDYGRKQIELLNKKLESLGLEPADADEIRRQGERTCMTENNPV